VEQTTDVILVVVNGKLLFDDLGQLGRRPAVAVKARRERAFVIDFTKLRQLVRPKPAGATGGAALLQAVDTIVIEGAGPA